MNFDNLLLIDIETVSEHSSFDNLDDNWKELWLKKSEKYYDAANYNAQQAYLEKAGILAEFGKIICISTAYFFKDSNQNLKLKQKTISNHNETFLLNDFLLLCDGFVKAKKGIAFAGHNIKEFDLPYICRRLIINNIKLPNYLNLQGVKPWENNNVDTLHWWRFGDYKNYISLNLLATALNIPSSKNDIDGSQVQSVYYQQNDLHRIAQYCAKDVQVVAQILLRFNNLELLSNDSFIQV